MTVIYIHIHIPKNAGTTFNGILRRQFGHRYIDVGETWPGQVLSADEKAQVLARNAEARCISSHSFRYPAPPTPGVEYRYITFLRHPLGRLVSLYAFEKQVAANNPSHSSHRSMEEWVESRLQEDNALTNFQTFHLLGLPAPGELDLEQAYRLVDSFFLVGIVESFDPSLLLLANRMRRPYYNYAYRKDNVTRSSERFPVTDALKQRLLDLNSLDLHLYDYAVQRLRQGLAAMPPHRLAAQSRQLKRLNDLGPSEWPLWLRIGQRLGLIRAITDGG
jgi:hypothetical protein